MNFYTNSRAPCRDSHKKAFPSCTFAGAQAISVYLHVQSQSFKDLRPCLILHDADSPRDFRCSVTAHSSELPGFRARPAHYLVQHPPFFPPLL